MSTDASRLDGLHAVVTGGSRGIGAAAAEALARAGATVTIMSRDAGALAARANAIGTRGLSVNHVACDVTDDAAIEHAFREAERRGGRVAILVNNAGSADAAPLSSTTRQLWDRMIALNLTATYACTARVLPAMLANGHGRIVNVASTAGLRGYKTMTAYCAAKHGVVGFTRALAQETAKRGVTVNAVCPGYTDTDLAQKGVRNLMEGLGKSEEEALDMLIRPIPRGMLTTVDEVADAIVWLSGHGAAAVTGIALPVAGGEVG